MIKKFIKIFALLGFIVTSFNNVHAEEKAQIQKIQDYLTGIKTFRADLYQLNADGSIQKGVFYLLREFKKTSYGKLRIEYQPPINDLIIVDGENLIYFDSRAKEKNSYGVEYTPAAFLLTPQINFSGDLKVKSFSKDGDRIILKVIRRGDDSSGLLTLKFQTQPYLKLNGWEVSDPQGNVTQVELLDVVIGIDLDPSLFKDKK